MLKTPQGATSSPRRFTPYTRTPHSRRIKVRCQTTQGKRKQVKSRKKEENENAVSSFKGFTNKTWKVFKLTPLCNFKTTPKDLKRYSRLLSAAAEAANQKGSFVENNISGKAEICVQKGLKKSEADPEAIQILIKGKTRTGTTETVILNASLCGVEMEDVPIPENLQDSFTYYPLLLVKATVALQDVLIMWLQRYFDCKVTPMIFPPCELAWMIAMWGGCLTDTGHKWKPVELVYQVPKECEGIHKITYTVDASDCQRIWQSIHDEDDENFTEEERKLFISSLEEHFYAIFRVKLNAMQLSRVGTSLCYVGREGQLKIFSSDHVIWILRHLTELSVEHFSWL